MREVFGIYDRRLGAYMTPMFCANDGMAMRQFEASVLYHETPMQQFPGEFELHGLGRFDELVGRFQNFDAPVVLTNARDVIEAAHEVARNAEVERSGNAASKPYQQLVDEDREDV